MPAVVGLKLPLLFVSEPVVAIEADVNSRLAAFVQSAVRTRALVRLEDEMTRRARRNAGEHGRVMDPVRVADRRIGRRRRDRRLRDGDAVSALRRVFTLKAFVSIELSPFPSTVMSPDFGMYEPLVCVCTS